MRLSPLHEAAYYGKMDVVQLLLDKNVVVDAKNKDGKTPQDLAEERGYKKLAELLPTSRPDYGDYPPRELTP